MLCVALSRALSRFFSLSHGAEKDKMLCVCLDILLKSKSLNRAQERAQERWRPLYSPLWSPLWGLSGALSGVFWRSLVLPQYSREQAQGRALNWFRERGLKRPPEGAPKKVKREL